MHAGVHVRHRSRVRADASQPNLRQVHLIAEELFEEVAGKGYEVRPGNLGENVTTSGIDLLGLPTGTILRFGPAPATPAGDAGGAWAAPEGGHGSAGESNGAAGERDGAASAGEGMAGEGGNGPAGASGLGTAAAGVLTAAAAARLDESTAAAVEAVAAAAARDAARQGADDRPAIVVAGLRNPCQQINGFRPGLLKEVVGHDADGRIERRAGVMAVVLRGGVVRPGDAIGVELPPLPHARLDRV